MQRFFPLGSKKVEDMNTSNNNSISYPVSGTARRVALGSFLDFIGSGIKVVEHILFVPLFLWAWGEALYGEWLILFSLIAYLSLSNIGMGNFVTNKMTQFYSRGNMKDYIKTFRSAFSLYTIITVVMFLLLLVFAFSAPFLDWFNIEVANEISVRTSVLILGTYILLGTLSGLIVNLYITVGDYVRFKMLANIKEILLICFIALTLFFKGGFASVASLYLIFLLAFMFFVIFDIRRHYPGIILKNTKTDWKLAFSFITPGFIFLMIPFAEVITLQGSILLIGSSLGAMAVVTFSVHRTLANLIRKLTGIMYTAIRPELAADEARGNYGKIQLIHDLLIKIIFLLSISAAVFLFFMGGDIIRAWTGGEIEFQPLLWMIFLVSIPVAAIWNFSSIFQVAMNKYTELAVIRVISAFIGLILAFIFIKPWGIVGVLLGFVLMEILLNSWFITYRTLKLIKGSFKKFLFTLAKGLLILIVQFPVALLIARYITNKWLLLVVLGTGVFAAGSCFTYWIWMNDNEKKITSDFMKRAISKCKRKL